MNCCPYQLETFDECLARPAEKKPQPAKLRLVSDDSTRRAPIRTPPRLFNWITALLVAVWVSIVAIVVEISQPTPARVLSADAIVETLAN